MFLDSSIGNVNRKVWRTSILMLGYGGLINSENQFTSSFDIQFGPTNFIFREDGFVFHV